MYSPITIGAGDCLEPDQIEQSFGNLEYFRNCAESISEQFKCKSISGSQTGDLNQEFCFSIQGAEGTVNPSPVLEHKMLIFDTVTSSSITNSLGEGNAANGTPGSGTVGPSGSSGANVSETDLRERIVVKCDGQIVSEVTVCQLATACFTCPASSHIEICYTATPFNPTISNLTGTRTTRICGALVCVGEVQTTALNSYFNPGYKPDGKYGRDYLHLLLQNLRAFQDLFSEFGQIPDCQSLEYNDADDHLVLANLATDTEYLIIGKATVCARNVYTSTNAYVYIEPNLSCGSESLDCFNRRFTLEPAEEGNGPGAETECFTVPIIGCGVCRAGESLIVGLQQSVDCSDEPSPVVDGGGGILQSANQEYCLYTFEKISTDFGDQLPGSIGKCVEESLFTRIREVSDLIAQICDELRPIEQTICQDSGFLNDAGQVLVKPAQTWPPPTPPPRPIPDPPPIKKWWASICVTACFTASISSDNGGGIRLVGRVRVMCGGVELDSFQDEIPLTETFLTRPRCVDFAFQGCIECPIDQDITLIFEADRLGGSDGSIQTSTFEYDYKLICY